MMPAYNYFPATYQNPYYQQQFATQNQYIPQMQQQVQPQVQQTVQQNGIIWVSGDDEALAYPIAPNNAVRLWHSSLPIVYFKSADASGKPALKAYDLVERSQNVPARAQKSDFATKNELASLSETVDALRDEMKFIKKEIGKKKDEVIDHDDEQ